MRALIGQVIRWPFAMTGYFFEMLAATARGLEQLTDQSLRRTLPDNSHGKPASSSLPAPPAASMWSSTAQLPPLPPTPPVTDVRTAIPEPALRQPATEEERTTMADTNLNDEMVKLVQYTIVTVEREKEDLLEGPKEIIVTDDLTGNAFSNARIAKWIERTGGRRTKGDYKGKKVDPDTLRVYYNVKDRWPKEDLKFDEKTLKYDQEKIEVLREISKKLP